MPWGWVVTLSVLGALAAVVGGFLAALPRLVAPVPGAARGTGLPEDGARAAGDAPAKAAEPAGAAEPAKADAPLGRILAALGRPPGERAVITLSEGEVNALAGAGVGLLAAMGRFGPRQVELRLEPGEVEGRVVLELPPRLPFAPLRGRRVGFAFRLGVGMRGQWLEVRVGPVSVGRLPLPVRFGLWVAGQVRLPPILAVEADRRTLLISRTGLSLPGLARGLDLEDVLVSRGSLTVTLGPRPRP